jgi:hypothetical protein
LDFGYYLVIGVWSLVLKHSIYLRVSCKMLALFLLKSAENLLDLLSTSELGWKEFDLTPLVHLPSQASVFQEIAGLGLKLENEAQFVNPALRFDRIQKDGVEDRNILFSRFDSGADGDISQGIHDLGDIDVIGTPDTAGVTGGADPDRLGPENLFPVIVLDMTKDLVGKQIHGVGHGASCRTFLALIAILNVFAARLMDFR